MEVFWTFSQGILHTPHCAILLILYIGRAVPAASVYSRLLTIKHILHIPHDLSWCSSQLLTNENQDVKILTNRNQGFGQKYGQIGHQAKISMSMLLPRM